MSIRKIIGALRPARPAAGSKAPATRPERPARLDQVTGGKVSMQDFHFVM